MPPIKTLADLNRAAKDAWSPEARKAAAEARRAGSSHKEETEKNWGHVRQFKNAQTIVAKYKKLGHGGSTHIRELNEAKAVIAKYEEMN